MHKHALVEQIKSPIHGLMNGGGEISPNVILVHDSSDALTCCFSLHVHPDAGSSNNDVGPQPACTAVTVSVSSGPITNEPIP